MEPARPVPPHLTDWETGVWTAGFDDALLGTAQQERRRRPDLYQDGHLAGCWERLAQLLNRPGDGPLLRKRAQEGAHDNHPAVKELRRIHREYLAKVGAVPL